MLTIRDRPLELKLHIRGAVNNGLSKDEIKEVSLQCAIYTGVPAALDALRAASKAFNDMDSPV